MVSPSPLCPATVDNNRPSRTLSELAALSADYIRLGDVTTVITGATHGPLGSAAADHNRPPHRGYTPDRLRP
jgi:hypothetical protein